MKIIRYMVAVGIGLVIGAAGYAGTHPAPGNGIIVYSLREKPKHGHPHPETVHRTEVHRVSNLCRVVQCAR